MIVFFWEGQAYARPQVDPDRQLTVVTVNNNGNLYG